MAEFTVKPQVMPVPNFTGASQGIRTSDQGAGIRTLFDGLARTIETGVAEADRQTQNKIRDEVYAATDSVNNEFGLDDATLFEKDIEGRPRPAALSRAGQNLDVLQSAYERGDLKESHYWARMNSKVRQLRSRYPGYRAEIDSMVSSVVGTTPANALRSALWREWNDTEGQSDLGKMEDWAVKNGRLPIDYYDRAQGGNPYSLPELNKHVAERERQSAEIQDRRATLAMQADVGNVNTKEYAKTFAIEASTFVNTAINDATTAIGGNYQNIQKMVREAQNAASRGQPIDQQLVNQLRTQMGQLIRDTQLGLDEIYKTPFTDDPKSSYIANLDPQEKERLVEQALIPLTTLEQALAGDNPYSVIGSVANYLEANKLESNRSLLESIPALQTLQSLNDLTGPDMAGMYMSLNPQVQEALGATLLEYHGNSAALGGSSIVDAFADGERTDQGPEYYNALITRWQNLVETVGSDDIPLSLVEENVRFMFGEDSQIVLSKLEDAERFKYFEKIANPRVTKKMLELKKAGGDEAWQMYQQWVTGAFMTLFQEDVQALNSANKNPQLKGVTVKWDSASNGFTVKSEGMFGVGGFERESNLNRVIRTVAPIITSNGGDMGKELLIILKNMGFNPNTTREPGMVDMMINALANAFEGQNGNQ